MVADCDGCCRVVLCEDDVGKLNDDGCYRLEIMMMKRSKRKKVMTACVIVTDENGKVHNMLMLLNDVLMKMISKDLNNVKRALLTWVFLSLIFTKGMFTVYRDVNYYIDVD